MSRRMRLLWYTRNVSRAHYGLDDDGLFNADCACGVTLAGNEPATFADAERSHAEQVRAEPRDRPCGPALPTGIPGIAPAPDALAAAEERGRRAGVEAKDAAYAERNQCVVLLVRMALALGWRAGVRDHEDKPGEEWEPDWRNLVCIDLPSGQVSWHFHDSEKHLLAGLPQYPASWDGHDTAEKYRRVNAALAPRDSGKET